MRKRKDFVRLEGVRSAQLVVIDALSQSISQR